MQVGIQINKALINFAEQLAKISPLAKAENAFHSWHYLRHNARRLEHLASLEIPVAGKTVLEIGAGIGDHSHYYIDRGCKITITEARSENLDYLKSRYPQADIRHLDLESPAGFPPESFDVIHAYGILYHLSKPEPALDFMACRCKEFLFLETCVSFGPGDAINLVQEPQHSFTQSFIGVGCRPTRGWLHQQLKKRFEYVYVPQTQPNHEEFPIDWNAPEKHKNLSRSVFIASRQPLFNPRLLDYLPMSQLRHY